MLLANKPKVADTKTNLILLSSTRQPKHLTNLRIGEYSALVAAADIAGHYGVGVLLESCLADKIAFVERTRRLIREVVEVRVAKRKDNGIPT